MCCFLHLFSQLLGSVGRLYGLQKGCAMLLLRLYDWGPALHFADKGIHHIMTQSSSVEINKKLKAGHWVYSSVQIRSRISSNYYFTKDVTGSMWGPLHYTHSLQIVSKGYLPSWKTEHGKERQWKKTEIEIFMQCPATQRSDRVHADELPLQCSRRFPTPFFPQYYAVFTGAWPDSLLENLFLFLSCSSCSSPWCC